MKSPIFGKEKLLYFPQKSGIVPIFKKSPSSYISYFCHHAPCTIIADIFVQIVTRTYRWNMILMLTVTF